jgi:hypothetical protein
MMLWLVCEDQHEKHGVGVAVHGCHDATRDNHLSLSPTPSPPLTYVTQARLPAHQLAQHIRLCHDAHRPLPLIHHKHTVGVGGHHFLDGG